MLGAHIYVYTYDAIPIYLPILTYPSYLPTYLIIPSGPLGAISDLHTERRDGFTAWLCTTSIYSSPGRAEPSRTESRHVDFAPFCSYFRKSEERLANSGIAERVAFSLPLTRAPCSVCRVHGNSCSLHSARNARETKAYCRHVRSAPLLRCVLPFFGGLVLPRLELIQDERRQDISGKNYTFVEIISQ